MGLFKLKLFRLLTKVPVIRKSARQAAYDLSKETKEEIICNIFTGQKMLLKIQDWVQYHLFMYGYYELAESEFWINYTKGKSTVFDIGANVGYFSLMASKVLAEGGKVYSFEPVSKTLNRLKENLQLNKIENVITEKMAISDRKGTLTINVGNDNNWGMSSINKHDQTTGGEETVTSDSIDNFIERNKITQLEIVKIDIEGAEFAAVKGMQKTLKSLRPVVLIEVLDAHLNRQGFSSKDIYQLFFDAGYKAFEIKNGNTLERILTPKSYDGLVCFHPVEKQMPAFITIKN